MGALYSKLHTPLSVCADSVTEIITGRKRKREDDSTESSDEISDKLDKLLCTPKKKKLMTTTQYIYQSLYKDQKNSDIQVEALGKIWHLHKFYLCQSRYFEKMFSGDWRETSQKYINIEIVDPKINIDAIDAIFGSLYSDEVTIEPKNVISILATAMVFHMEAVVSRCSDVMIETINAETAVLYYEAACEYGVNNLKTPSFNWLLTNLLTFYSKHPKWLRLIDVDLMASLVSSPDLFVMQTEFSLYTLLRLWLYLKLNRNQEQIEQKTSKTDILNYFSENQDKIAFLQTPKGKPYEKPFRKLRIQHLLNHPVDLKILLDDNIIPRSWLSDPLLLQWNSMLKIDQSLDNGPKECDSKIFYETCLRCGRLLKDSSYQKWRWTGFNFGLDLILISDTRTLSIKRQHHSEHERLLSLQVKRQFLVRVTIASLNEQRQVKHSQTTDIKSLTLDKQEEVQLIYMENALEYPLLISVNLLVVSPSKKEINQTSTNIIETPISNIGSSKSPLTCTDNNKNLEVEN